MNDQCNRCGRCCIHVGIGFWLHGNFEGCPELFELAERTEDQDNGMPCLMLVIEDGLACCKIERDYGRQFKPDVCKGYGPADECFFIMNQGLMGFDGKG